MDLRGFEFYAITGNPVSGAAVTVRAASVLHPNPNSIAATTTTDPNGMWEVTGLAEGAYDVDLSISGKTWRHKGMSKLSLSGLYINGQIYTPVNWAKNGGVELWPNGNGAHTLSTSADTTHLPPFSITIGTGSSGNLTKETTIAAPGSQASAKVVYTHSSGQFKAEYTVGNAVLWALKGKTVTIQFHVYQGASNQCRVDLNDGTTTTSSSRSTTTGSWITMSATAAIGTSATALKFSIIADVSGTFYFDNAILVAGSTVPMYMPHALDQDQAQTWFGGDFITTGSVYWGTSQRRLDTIPSSNLNNISVAGWYFAASGTTNNPTATDYMVQHIPHSSSSGAVQIATANAADGPMYYRRHDGSSWQSWKKVWNESNDGTGSGLDADLLDGIEATGFLRSGANSGSISGVNSISFTSDGGGIKFNDGPTCQITAFAGSGFTVYCGAGEQIRFLTPSSSEIFRAKNSESAPYFKGTALSLEGHSHASNAIIGEVREYAGTTEADVSAVGFRFCEGQAVSRTTYSALFAKIGTTYGSGDGSTTFNLPELRGRVIFGSGTTYSLGAVGGQETINIAHTHTGGAHSHGAGSYAVPISLTTGTEQGGTLYDEDETGGGHNARDGHTHAVNATPSVTGTSGSAGAVATDSQLSASQSVVNPYLAMHYMIYTGVVS